MIKYNINETGSKIILTTPEQMSIKNPYTASKYLNDTKKNTLSRMTGNKYIVFSNIALQTITINDNGDDTRLYENKDITLGFKLTDDEKIELKLSNDHTEFKEVIREICDPKLIIDEAIPYFIEFINTVLFELCYNSNDYTNALNANLIKPTITVTTADTETLTDATVTITVTDPSEQPIKDINLIGTVTVGNTTIDIEETTDADGEATITLETEGEHTIHVSTVADTNYDAVDITETVTTTTISAEPEQSNP